MLSVTYTNSDSNYEILSIFQSLYQPLSCLHTYCRIIGIIKLIEMLLNYDVAKKGMLLCSDVTVPEFGVQLKLRSGFVSHSIYHLFCSPQTVYKSPFESSSVDSSGEL